MAYPQAGTLPTKLSFAKIAAMPAPSVVPALPNLHKDSNKKHQVGPHPVPRTENYPICRPVPTPEPTVVPSMSPDDVEKVRSVIEELGLSKEKTIQLQSAGSGESLEDDQSQLSSSSLKQQSFETKSMTSVTTFAMDEKESIRPDDSASVRAVDEDESRPTLSRHSSFQMDTEPHTIGNRPALRTVAPNVTITAQRFPTFTLTNPPRFGDLPVSPVTEAPLSQPDALNPVSPTHDLTHDRLSSAIVTPDDKLLEALTSFKDRLPLLQLEERLVAFINQSREDVLELPPQNSFTRLLTHKLADYYNVAHQANEDNSSVRIFRSSSGILPPSLADIAKSIPVGSQPVNAATQVKIMRRSHFGGRPFSADNSTAASSSAPSKATSENGGEFNVEDNLNSPSEGTPNRDKSKLTREEREAQYKAARERIFSDFQGSVTSESGSTGETSASMSRSSSSSGKRKARKHKTPKDDSFDSRSAFIAYGPMQMQQAVAASYTVMGSSGPYQNQRPEYSQLGYGPSSMEPSYQNFDPSLQYATSNNYMSSNSHGFGASNGWQALQQSHPNAMYNVPTMPQYQTQAQMLPHMSNAYLPPMQTAQPTSGWGQHQYSGPDMQGAHVAIGQWPTYDATSNSRNLPFQYGQPHPQNFNGNAPYGNQSAPSNAYSNPRSLFNPQTRSFIPNHPNRGGRNPRKKGGNASRGSDASGAGSPSLALRNDNGSPMLKEDSLQQKYGTPPTLPKKPPPSQVPHHFTGEIAGASGQNPGGSLSNNGPLVSNSNGSIKTGV